MGNIADALREAEEKQKLYGSVKTPLNDKPEIKNYMERIGAGFIGQTRAVIRQRNGQYIHNKASIRFNIKKRKVFCTKPEYAPTEEERQAIEKELATIEMSNCIPFLEGHQPPEQIQRYLKDSTSENFIFLDSKGVVLMYVIRAYNDNGKYFIPYTYWDDGEIREEETDEKLPLYGLDQALRGCRVFIHEGMGAAKYWRQFIEANNEKGSEILFEHPYCEFLSTGAHLGWHGGAPNPERTDWNELKNAGVIEIIIVSDNDEIGKAAAYKISRLSGIKAKVLQFNECFPKGYDLADPIPKALLSKNGKYIGPDILNMLHPATWASYKYVNADKRQKYHVNKEFLEEWIYVSDQQVFVHIEFPNRRYSISELNNYYRRFSDTPKVAELILDARNNEVQKLCYNPSQKSGIITTENSAAYNVFQGTKANQNNDDYSIFLEFLEYLIPNESDRVEVMRWCATLIARPEVRMTYSLLLISETQGTGKTTLAEQILASLVGSLNVSFPSEQMILSQFNGWAGFKRLAVVSEIYQGNGWKAANILKALVTDKYIEVNEKHKSPVVIENWLHIVASSNSRRALKIDQDDRRWLIPKLTEEKWPKHKFTELYLWLKNGGLGAIKTWAMNFENYVKSGDVAPNSSLKNEIIDESRSNFVQDALSVAELFVNSNKPYAIAMKPLINGVKENSREICYDQPNDFIRALKHQGWHKFVERFHVFGNKDSVVMNRACFDLIDGKTKAEAKAILRQNLLSLEELSGAKM